MAEWTVWNKAMIYLQNNSFNKVYYLIKYNKTQSNKNEIQKILLYMISS